MDELKYHYKYPHPAVTADAVVFGFDGYKLHVLLVERGVDPYKGMWALPGGFMRIDETAEQCAVRELMEETGVRNVYLEQFHTFSAVGRDPRERVVTIAYIALVRQSDYRLIAGDDAARAAWFDVDKLPPLAFDHGMILSEARRYLREVLQNRRWHLSCSTAHLPWMSSDVSMRLSTGWSMTAATLPKKPQPPGC